MSRRQLTLALAAAASLAVSACSATPTAPQTQLRAPRANADVTPPVDTTARTGWMGSSG